jgi:EAL domain-containing protein (putative c-di-GMP-specific phosphodiesterase class I)
MDPAFHLALSPRELESRFNRVSFSGKVAVLSLLPERGIRLAIDDFGVGYSNLIYLRRFAVDAIKIDQYFVEHAATREQDALLVKAIMDLGKSLKKSVIAEGVETEQQLAFLTAIGCDQVQGSLLGNPMEAHTLVAAMNVQMSQARG